MLRPHRLAVPLCFASLVTVTFVSAEQPDASPPQLTAPVETVGLFKNGLAVIRRLVTLPAGDGRIFDITDLPEPVHGTFWIESTAVLTVTITEAEVARDDESAALPAMDNRSLAGATVRVYFKQEHVPMIEGVVTTPPSAARSWDRSYGWTRPRETSWWSGDWSGSRNNVYLPQPAAQSLVLDTEDGKSLIDPSSVAYLQIIAQPDQRTERRPVMRIAFDESGAQSDIKTDIEVGILYLTKGAAWAPSYSIDITESSQLALRQKAVIRNELEDFADAEILLISGFPNIEFSHVLSPMSPATNLASFFRALGSENRLSHASRGDVMSQAVMGNFAASGGMSDGSAVENPSLIGDDLHYHSIGRHTLALGDTLLINTARAQADYERIVQWTQPDDRDIWGQRRAAEYSYNTRESMDQSDPWDALRFRNPLDRPMTTAPAMIVKDGLVRGQSMVHWTSPGERNTLRINKALSVRTSVEEIELEDERVLKTMYGRDYRRSTVQGTFHAVNQRAEPITLVAAVEFSGELIEAAGEPAVELRGEGVWSANPRRQMRWTLELAPDESRELEYSYHVYMPR